MRPEDAYSERFDVLLIDDICSFLTPHLVKRLHQQGRRVVGVYSPAEHPDGQGRLLSYEVSDTIEASAAPEDFLALMEQLGINRHRGPEPAEPETEDSVWTDDTAAQPGSLVAVGSPPGGCGATEVAIGIARRLGERYEESGLVDLDQRAPSVAQRLGLGLYPNLLTAIDAVHHHSDQLESCWQTPRGSSVKVLSGVPSPVDRTRLRRGDVAEVLLEICREVKATVVNIGLWEMPTDDRPLWESGTVADAVLEMAGALVGVALPTPVGMVRMIEWIGGLRARHPGITAYVVVNRTPGSLFVRKALAEELRSAMGGVRVAFLPEDQLVSEAAWNGVLVERGKFRRGCDRLADQVIVERPPT